MYFTPRARSLALFCTAVLTVGPVGAVSGSAAYGSVARGEGATPTVTRLPLTPVAAPADLRPGARRVLASLRAENRRLDATGVTVTGPLPAGFAVSVRTRVAGTWGPWKLLELGNDADPESADARSATARTGASHATEPYVSAGADGVEFSVAASTGLPAGTAVTADLVDGGSAASDASPAAQPAAAADVTGPAIISRAGWGANEALKNCVGDPVERFSAAVVHHTAGSNTYTAAQVPAILRAIYAYHTQSIGWCDIGYQYLVDKYGRVFEGRAGSISRNVAGAQAGGFNHESFGVSALGDFTSVAPPAAVTSAVTRVIAWRAALNGFDPASTTTLTSGGFDKWPAGARVTVPRVIGHRELNYTGCPGNAYYPLVPTIRANAHTLYAAGPTSSWTPLTPATVKETFLRPSGTTLPLAGHGYGHGYGLSQWGAYGAATKGLTSSQITSFYYPGTTAADQGNPTIRVRISALGTAGVTAPPQSGLTFFDGSSTRPAPGAMSYRVVPEGAGATLQWQSGGQWVSSGFWKAWTRGPLTLGTTAGSVRVALPAGGFRDYAGSVGMVRTTSTPTTVNLVPVESYLRSVVPSEMPPSWPAAALAAQAVAARSYAAYGMSRAGTNTTDTCDTTACQVYSGIADHDAQGVLVRSHSFPSTDAAVAATAGRVLRYAGAPIVAYFSASNGGRTMGSSIPYLVGKADPYDGAVAVPGNPNSWTLDLPIATVEKAYPSIGTLSRIVIESRFGGGDWSGRVTGLTLVGSTGQTTVTGDAFRWAVGLKSQWWTVTSPAPSQGALFPRDLTADSLPDQLVVDGPLLRSLSYTGSMWFSPKVMGGSGGLSLVTNAGRFDGDNLPDVLARHADGSLWIHPGNAKATLDRPGRVVAAGFADTNLLVPVGDVTADGFTDLVSRDTSGRMHLRRGNGSGGLVSDAVFGAGWSQFGQITAGDVDGNGTVDLVAVRAVDGRMFAYAGDGRGGFAAAVAMGTTDWRFAKFVRVVGDLTGDRRHDVLALRSVDSAILVHPLTTAGIGGVGAPINAGTYPSSATWAQ